MSAYLGRNLEKDFPKVGDGIAVLHKKKICLLGPEERFKVPEDKKAVVGVVQENRKVVVTDDQKFVAPEDRKEGCGTVTEEIFFFWGGGTGGKLGVVQEDM
jgi:hypothetical protein